MGLFAIESETILETAYEEGLPMLENRAKALKALSLMDLEQVENVLASVERSAVFAWPYLTPDQIAATLANYQEFLGEQLACRKPHYTNIERPPLFW